MTYSTERAQELVDAGYSSREIGKELGVHHSRICRELQKGVLLNDYVPFAEPKDKAHLYQNFEWLWEEDKLEEICNKAFDEYYVNINEEILGEDFISVGRYLRETYGGLKGYLKKKNKAILYGFIYGECKKCKEVKQLTKFCRKSTGLYGVDLTSCNKCTYARVNEFRRNNEEYVEKCRESARAYQKTKAGKLSMQVSSLNRRAMKGLLPDTLTTSQVEIMLGKFNGCVLTGRSDDLHLDHVIPLSIGHGGTTYENIIPLSDKLNLSKNDGNIFEWFSANKQRFNLSQDKFDTLIDYLAELNEMTREEYCEYVYWCHANPRTVDQLREEDAS